MISVMTWRYEYLHKLILDIWNGMIRFGRGWQPGICLSQCLRSAYGRSVYEANRGIASPWKSWPVNPKLRPSKSSFKFTPDKAPHSRVRYCHHALIRLSRYRQETVYRWTYFWDFNAYIMALRQRNRWLDNYKRCSLEFMIQLRVVGCREPLKRLSDTITGD